MKDERKKNNAIKYEAAFQKVGEGVSFWYRGGRITLFEDCFVLSILGITRIEVSYKEILTIQKERYNLNNCITVYCVAYHIYIRVSASNRDKVFDELQRRMRSSCNRNEI